MMGSFLFQLTHQLEFPCVYPNDLKMQTSELHQRAQVKLNYGRNGYSLST
ncbi:hypothetical protein [Vibrio tritonius]|nr:hypothetical protein [Vibrio tritonius]